MCNIVKNKPREQLMILYQVLRIWAARLRLVPLLSRGVDVARVRLVALRDHIVEAQLLVLVERTVIMFNCHFRVFLGSVNVLRDEKNKFSVLKIQISISKINKWQLFEFPVLRTFICLMFHTLCSILKQIISNFTFIIYLDNIRIKCYWLN